MVAHDVTMNPDAGGEGDASTKCNTAMGAQNALGPHPEPEVKNVLDEAVALCAFEIPVATAAEALAHLRFSPSQASRRLMCDVATRELDRARPIRPKDPHLRNVDARRVEACTK